MSVRAGVIAWGCVAIAVLSLGACTVTTAGDDAGAAQSSSGGASSSGGSGSGGTTDAAAGDGGATQPDASVDSGVDATASDAAGSETGSDGGGGDATMDASASADGNPTEDADDSGDVFEPDGSGWDDVALPDAGLPLTPTSATQAWLNELDVYQNGGTIPAAPGSGQTTVTVNADGSHTVTVAGNGGTTRVLMQWTSPQAYTLTADQNADGVADEQMNTTTSNGVTTTVWQIDTRLDGSFAWQDTMTLSSSGVSSYLQQAPFGSTTLAGVGSFSASAMQPAVCAGNQAPQDSCNPLQLVNASYPPQPNYCNPPDPPAPCPNCGGDVAWPGQTPNWTAASLSPVQVFSSSPRFQIITSGPMACNPDAAGLLIEAVLAYAGVDFDNMVGPINASYQTTVDNAIGNGVLYYGCWAPPSSGFTAWAATANAYFSDVPGAQITAINPAAMKFGPDALEELIVHEWFHAAGLVHMIDSLGSDARDFIYSCSRVTNQCRAWAEGFYLGGCCNASSARDGAMCADLVHKALYGYQTLFVETDSPYSELASGSDQPFTQDCTDLATSVVAAECAIEQMDAFCDQTSFTQTETTQPLPGGPDDDGGVLPGGDGLSGYGCAEICPAGFEDAVYACGTSQPPTVPIPQSPQVTLGGPTLLWMSPWLADGEKYNGSTKGLADMGSCTQAKYPHGPLVGAVLPLLTRASILHTGASFAT